MNVAVVGVGNCCCSLVQAISASKQGELRGLSYDRIGPYKVSDIQIAAAFDVDARKIGKDLAHAIFETPNCTTRYTDVADLGIQVQAGALSDGVSPRLHDVITIHPSTKDVTTEDITKALQQANAEVVVCYLPVGSDEAAKLYATAAVNAGCAFVNCMPASIAMSQAFQEAFYDAGLPLLGDDMKSQIGSTAIHRALIAILQKKGMHIQKSYQLNVGGNTDFQNMRDPDRAKGKKGTKEVALRHLLPQDVELSVGPSDHVPFLKDFKIGTIYVEGTGILDAPFSLECKIKVEDSPNSADIALNAVRVAKFALDQGHKGVVPDACAYLFKNPPVAMDESKTFENFDRFVGSTAKAA